MKLREPRADAAGVIATNDSVPPEFGRLGLIRNRHGPHVVVAGADELVVGGEEVAPAAPVVSQIDRQTGAELVLHGYAVVPVVRPDAPATQDGGIDPGGIRIEVAEVQVGAGQRPADVTARGAGVLRRRTQQIAVDRVVAVRVRPRTARPDLT